METDVFNSLVVHNFFSVNANQGWNWVAFDQDDDVRISGLMGFISALEANRFCSGSNMAFDYMEQEFVDANYRYLAVDTLRKVIEPQRNNIDVSFDFKVAVDLLKEAGISPLRNYNPSDIERYITEGNIFPAEHQRLILPSKDIDRYIIVTQSHDPQKLYEVGQNVQIKYTCASKDEAEARMDELLLKPLDGVTWDEYQLIGLYRGQGYKIDLNGKPEDTSGTLIKQANFQYDLDKKSKIWHIDPSRSIEDPIPIRRFLYVQFDLINLKWKFLDDELKESIPAAIKPYGYPQYFINEKFTIKQLEIMNEQSYDYVANQLKYLGFGEEIAKPLREKMVEGLNEFTLTHSKDFGKDKTESVLQFSKGDDVQKDLTFFNGFNLTLKQEGKEDLTQHFFVGKEFNYTLQERYNMMDGRFVFREQPKVEPKEVNGETKMVPTGETYTAWKGLNFKESDERGNFLPKTMFWRHDKEIVKYPIKEIAEPYDKNRLLASMQKGNKANVTILRGEDEIKGTVSANPKMQRFDFYDANGQTLYVKQVEKQKLAKNDVQEQDQSQGPENKEKQEQGQQQSHAPEKKDAVAQTSGQSTAQTESKGQTPQQNEKPDHKEGQKAGIAEEQKEGTGQRRRQGVKV